MKALQTLCSNRKVFQSQKLFSKGACYSLAYEYGLLKMPNLIIRGQGMIKNDYGIIIKRNGKEEFVPMIKAGTRWYNAFAQIVVILDGIDTIPVYVKESSGRVVELGTIDLDELPKRPNKATKLSVDIQYISQTKCKVSIEDLGFGKLFPKSDKSWNKIFSI